jgi:hypothetical protein
MLFDVTWQSELYGLWMFMVDISIRSSNVSDNQHLPSNILPHRHFIIHRSDDIYFPIWFYISNVYVVVHQIIHMVDISNVYGVCVYIYLIIYIHPSDISQLGYLMSIVSWPNVSSPRLCSRHRAKARLARPRAAPGVRDITSFQFRRRVI